MMLITSFYRATALLIRTSRFPSIVIRTVSARNMSASSAPTKHEWIVILPDHAGALERRMQVRQDHLKNLTPQVEKGFWTFGGAMLDEAPKEGEGLKIKGSVMVASAESKEEVLEALKRDIYCTSGVWDWDRVQIHPFKTAVRKPL